MAFSFGKTRTSKTQHTPVGARWLASLREAGVCLECGAAVPAKSRALWLMNRGVLCVRCGEEYAKTHPVKGR